MYSIIDGLGTGAAIAIVAAVAAAYVVWRSLWTIGPTEVGLVRKVQPEKAEQGRSGRVQR
jgi:hypothetical protein